MSEKNRPLVPPAMTAQDAAEEASSAAQPTHYNAAKRELRGEAELRPETMGEASDGDRLAHPSHSVAEQAGRQSVDATAVHGARWARCAACGRCGS